MFFCASISKECTPQKFLGHMGLGVDNRPFNIHFNYSEYAELEASLLIKHVDNENVTHEVKKTFNLKPVKPNYYTCFEGFSYFNKSWLGCSCKVSFA